MILGYRGNSLYQSNGISVVASAEYSVEELSRIALFEAVPNPANVNSNISFYLLEEAKVTITLYNVVGEVLEAIVESNFKSGLHINI